MANLNVSMCNDSDPVMAFPVILVVYRSLSHVVGWKHCFRSIHGQAKNPVSVVRMVLVQRDQSGAEEAGKFSKKWIEQFR